MNPAFIRQRLNELRTQRHLSMRALCRDMKLNGYSAKKIFDGDIESTRDKALLRAIIEYFGMTEDEFYKRAPAPNIEPVAFLPEEHTGKVPLYGHIPAGTPIPVDGKAEPEAWIDAPPGMRARNLFALRVKGNSMTPRFLHGDIVYLEPLDIRMTAKDPECPIPSLTFERLDGRVVAALVDQEATLKQLAIVGKGKDYELELRPFNPEFSVLRIRPEHTVIFQGVAVKTVRDEA